jgi:carbon storage regulator
MLVLTRKLHQSIIIGDEIEVVVLEVRGEQVRLGIRAPHNVTVHRKEIYTQIHEENVASSNVDPGSVPETP